MDTVKQSSDLLISGEAVAQGDITLFVISEIPALDKQGPENGLMILAHSGTGHHHAIDYSDQFDVYEQDEFTAYIHNRSDNVIELKHHRNFHTHAPIGIPPNSKVKVIRGREYTPEGLRRVAD